MYNQQQSQNIEKQGNFPDWENWRGEEFLCTQKMENSKIKGNFPDWENWRGENKFMQYKGRKFKNAIPRTAPAMSCLRLKNMLPILLVYIKYVKKIVTKIL